MFLRSLEEAVAKAAALMVAVALSSLTSLLEPTPVVVPVSVQSLIPRVLPMPWALAAMALMTLPYLFQVLLDQTGPRTLMVSPRRGWWRPGEAARDSGSVALHRSATVMMASPA